MNAGKRDSDNAFPMSFEQKITLKGEIDMHTIPQSIFMSLGCLENHSPVILMNINGE